MSWLCKRFGHKPPSHRGVPALLPQNNGGHYADTHLRGVDGIGRRHADIYGDCPRCGKNYYVCSIHVPQPTSHGAGVSE